MGRNPFNNELEWAVLGKYLRVYDGERTYEGWGVRMHHDKYSILLHSATNTTTGEQLGTVFVRDCEAFEVLRQRKHVEWRELDDLQPYPGYDFPFTPTDNMIRRCYRNNSAGGFPVVREDGTIINGHKRLRAAEVAGLDGHPVEVLNVTDEQAEELFRVAHRREIQQQEQEEGTTISTESGQRIDGTRRRGYHSSR